MTSCDEIINKTKLLINDIVDNPVLRVQQESLSSGGLNTGLYKIRVTSVSNFGETTGNNQVTTNITSTGRAIKINIGRVKNALRFRIYVSYGSDDYTLQGEATVSQNSASVFTLSEYTNTGTVIPLTNTATEYLRHELYEVALSQALCELARHEPKETMREITLTSNIYEYNLPADWEPMVNYYIRSQLKHGNVVTDVELNKITVNYKIRLSDTLYFTTGDKLLFYYAAPYVCSDIPANKVIPLSMLTASYACMHIASTYSHTSNRQIGAEVINFDMRASEFRKMADMYREQALKLLSNRGNAVFTKWQDV